MNKIRPAICTVILTVGLILPLASCTTPLNRAEEIALPQPEVQESRDLSCSYFYFLWGTHAEFNNQFPEALDAYGKALVCDPDADYIQGKLPILHIKMGNIEQAVELIIEAINKNPQDTSQRALLARIYIQEKEAAKAIEQYQAILSYDPENEQQRLRLGVLLTQEGQLEKGRAQFEKLLELNQEAYYARLYLARIADRLGGEDAESHYSQALELNWSPDLSYEIAEFHLKNKQYPQAVEILRVVLDKDNNDERARLNIVQALLAMGQEEEAIAELSLARDSSGTPERISMVLSKLHLRNGDNQKAEENLMAILDTQENSEARYLLAVIYLESEDYQKALDVLEGISPEQEEFEDAVFLKSRILHQTGRTPEALVKLEHYLDHEGTDRPSFYILASSLYQEGGQSDQALDTLVRGLNSFPENERLLFEYGLQLERADRLEEAISIMERIITINPEHAEALNFVGYSWADSNRNLEQALEYIDLAMKLKPDNGYIQDSLGWIYFKLGKLDRARDELVDALKLVPDDPHIHDHLGDVYRALGLVADALASYKRAFEKFEDDEKKNSVQEKIDTLETP